MCPRSQGAEGGAIALLGPGLCLLVSKLLPAKAPRAHWAMAGTGRAGVGNGAPHALSFLPSLGRGSSAVCRALSKTPAALALNQTQHCKQLEGLVSAQVQLCRSNLELMHTVVYAAREVMKACRRAFADMRWNCSSIELAPNYLLDLERGRGPAGAAGAHGMRAGGNGRIQA